MNFIKSFGSKLCGRLLDQHRGQTMTEYALIMAAIAVVVFAVYQTMGTDITSVVNNVNGLLGAS